MSQPALVNSSDISCTAALPRPCPVCKSRQSAPLRRLQLVVPEDFALQHAFTINACEGCGAVFHDIRHQPDRESYYESYTGSATQDYKVSPDQARLNDLTLHFLEAAGLKPGHAAIADVGCSFGITLLALQQKGFENLEYPKRQNRPTHTNVEKYNKCSACNIILNGKFYVCVYAAFGTMLNAIPKNDDDFVDLVNSLLTNEEIANKLKKLLIETTTLTACDYCPDESVPVPIADQVDPHQFRITKKRK